MLRVLMVVDAAPPHYGGAGQQALMLAKELEAEGFSVQIYARRKEPSPSEDQIVKFIGPFVKSETISNLVFALLVFFKVLTSRADILHCHGAFYYGFSSAAAAKIRRIPIILKVTLLGTDDPSSVSNQTKFNLNVGRILVRQFFWADRVVALNSDIQKACVDFSQNITTVVVPNGVLLDEKLRQRRRDRVKLPVVAPRVIFTGDVCVRKGVDTLLAAWGGFLDLHPTASLSLVGPVREEISQLLNELRQSVRSTVNVEGKLDHHSTLSILEESDLFILPSRSEGLPNSLIEAMSMGLSCIASSIPVNRTLCDDSVTYCDPESPSSVDTALRNAVVNSRLMSLRALDRSSFFSIANTAAAYVDMYLFLTSTPNSRKASC